jgi:general secretion pathway protein G
MQQHAKKRHRRSRQRRAGFTLMELLIVIVILLALGGLAVVSLIDVKDKAEADITRVQMQNIQRALKDFRFYMGRYPTEEEGLSVLWSRDNLENEEDEANWRQFLEKPIREDNWGQPWNYRAESEYDLEYDLWSNGPDREEGTEDDIANWDEFTDEEGEMYDDMPDMELPPPPGG